MATKNSKAKPANGSGELSQYCVAPIDLIHKVYLKALADFSARSGFLEAAEMLDRKTGAFDENDFTMVCAVQHLTVGQLAKLGK